MMRIGVISDTHGLLRPDAVACLQDCDHIVHGGDVGNAEVLERLSAIAPVTAVRGNNDRAAWAAALPETELVRFEDVFVYVVHDLALIDIDPGAADIRVVVSGHSHQPLIAHRDGVLYVNPGSSGPRRFNLPVALAELRITGSEVEARLIELAPSTTARR